MTFWKCISRFTFPLSVTLRFLSGFPDFGGFASNEGLS